MPAPIHQPGAPRPLPRGALSAAGALAGFLALWAVLLAWGGPHDAATGLAVGLERLTLEAWPAWVYLASGAGWGVAVMPLLRRRGGGATPWALEAILGVAVLATLSHGLGALGLLSVPAVAWGVLVAGLAMLAWRAARAWTASRQPAAGGPGPDRWSIGLVALAGALGLAVLLAGAVQPPGWLWQSEFGGYDVLSYHLQLPREWLALGRVAPLEHNVYSFLPGYAESAFFHLGVIGGEGRLAYAAQALHAGLAVGSAAGVGLVTLAAARAAGLTVGVEPGLVAGALFLGVPWTAVTGSLAYNEMGLTLCFAGALLAGLAPGLSPGARGAAAGFLVGVACGFKPTAIFLAAPVVGLALVLTTPRGRWPGMLAWACVLGLAALGPWLIRNAAWSGNPVFPYMHGVFGPSHWAPEQFDRYADAHHFRGSMAQRVGLIALPDRADPARPGEPVHRGMLHPQFGYVFPLALAAIAALAWDGRTRRLGLAIAAALALPTLGWLVLTHVQARFLVPVLVAACPAVGLMAGGSPARARAGAAAALAVAGLSVLNFSRQREGAPNRALVGGVGLFDGGLAREALRGAAEQDQRQILEALGPEGFAALLPEAGPGAVYLLGDATPFHFRPAPLYHTTYDASPLGELMRAHPGDAAAWAEGLRRRGVRLVLWNAAEIDRLQRSGWHDPLVTNGAVASFLREHGELVREWPEQGRVLVRLREGGVP